MYYKFVPGRLSWLLLLLASENITRMRPEREFLKATFSRLWLY